MDEDQRRVIDIVEQYVRSLKKFRNREDMKLPDPLLMVVQGGTGSCKSFVIDLLAQWITKILRKPGDDPYNPLETK